MQFIDVTKDLILVLLKELKKSLRKHQIFAIIFPIVGIFVAIVTYLYFETFKEKVATVLFGIAGSFIGTVFVFQFQEITKDGKKISSLNALNKNIDTLKTEPSSNNNAAEEKIYDLFKETFKETIKS